MALEVLDILYITLIVFTTIIGTLLTLVLLRVMKAMSMVMEIVDFYEKIKEIIWAYKQIPDVIKEKAKEFMSKENISKPETRQIE